MKLLTLASMTAALCFANAGFAAPVCQYADSDSDGDGWGWENFQSCIVSDSSAASSASQNTTTTSIQTTASASTQSSSSNTPICTTANADSDGDGWGWEFSRSCIVSVTPQASPAAAATESASADDADTTATVADTSAPPIAAATDAQDPVSDIENGLYQGRHPVCSSASADGDGDGWGYEYNRSCKVVTGYVAQDAAPVIEPAGNANVDKVGQIYNQNFSAAAVGLYQADQLNDDWESPHWHLGFDQGRVSIVEAGGSRGKAMEVTYPAGKYGAGGASAFLSDVQFGMGLPETYEELYVAYDIRFEEGFDFVRGGKLPGLCGADVNQSPQTGCNTGGGYPTGYDGWSARGMWRENGALENYIYHAAQRNYYADSELWGVDAVPGVWHSVQHRVVLNTPGQKNGILEAWFDGKKVLSLNNLEYRKTSSIGINLFYFSTFFGGNDASWAPSTDQTMMFDNFVISTDKVN